MPKNIATLDPNSDPVTNLIPKNENGVKLIVREVIVSRRPGKNKAKSGMPSLWNKTNLCTNLAIPTPLLIHPSPALDNDLHENLPEPTPLPANIVRMFTETHLVDPFYLFFFA